MARIAGVDLPRGKRADIALTYIYGIGPKTALQIFEATNIEWNRSIDDLSLDVVKCKISLPRFHTLALCLVPFGIPKLFRDSPLAAELCYRSVDCNPSHDGDNSVLFLTAIHVEQHLECASCHTRFFLVAKL